MKRKIWVHLLLYVLVSAFFLAGCTEGKNSNKKETINSSDEEDKKDSKSADGQIAGVYIGDSREWVLEIYDDHSLMLDTHSDQHSGTYQTLDGEWLLQLENYAALKAEFTKEGNLYVTSDNSNWTPEIFRKDESIETKDIDLKKAMDENWSMFKKKLSDEEVNNFETVENYSDGTYDIQNSNGTRIEILPDDSVFSVCISDFESNYSIYGVKIGMNFSVANKLMEEVGYDVVDHVTLGEGAEVKTYTEMATYRSINTGDLDLVMYMTNDKVKYVYLSK